MAEPFRQGSIHRPLRVRVFTEAGVIDFPSEFPGGVVFKMTAGSTTVTGAATGDSAGNLIYQWQGADLDVVGTYAAVFIGTDGAGRTETFPTGSNLTIEVIAAL